MKKRSKIVLTWILVGCLFLSNLSTVFAGNIKIQDNLMTYVLPWGRATPSDADNQLDELDNTATLSDAIPIKATSSDAIIVDNMDENFSKTGDWGTSTSRKPFWGDNYLSISGPKIGTATWAPEIETSGFYEVYIWNPLVDDDSNITNKAPYTIVHADGSSEVEKSQRNAGGDWESIGSYRFKEGMDASVTLTKKKSDGNAYMADAAKFVMVQEDIEEVIIIVDDPDAELVPEKDWNFSTYRKGFYGDGYHSVANDRVDDPDAVYAKWSVDIPKSGFYKISVMHPEGNGETSISNNAPYEIEHSRGTKTVRLDQSEKGMGGLIRDLGSYYFEEGAEGTVTLSFGSESGKAIMADAVQFERIPDREADSKLFTKSAVSPWEETEYADAEGGSYLLMENSGDNTSRVSYQMLLSTEGGYRLLFHKPEGLDVSGMSDEMEVLINGETYFVDLTDMDDGYNTIAFCNLEAGKANTIEFLRSQHGPVFLDAIKMEYAGYSLHYTEFDDAMAKEWKTEGSWEITDGGMSGDSGNVYLSGKGWNNVEADVIFKTNGQGSFGMIVGGNEVDGWIRLNYDAEAQIFKLLDENDETLAQSEETFALSSDSYALRLDANDPKLRFYLDGELILEYDKSREDNFGFYSDGAAITLISVGINKAKDAAWGEYKVRLDQPNQTIQGLAIEIQSDYISSGNQGIPNEFINSVPHDLTQPERDRLYSDMLKGFRYMRMAGGLYYRGTDEQEKHLQERWDTQNEELAELIEDSGIEGIDFEFWSPTPYFKANESYREKGGDDPIVGLKCFDPVRWPEEAANKDAFLQDFADTIVTDFKYLKSVGLPVIQFSIQNEPKWKHDTGYSHCYYSGDNYYETALKVYPTVKEAFPNMHIHADSINGQYGEGSKKIIADKDLLQYVDAWTHHYMGSDSNMQINSADYLNSNKGRDDIQVYNTEFEYLDGKTSDWRCINTAQSIMNWMTFENSPIWHWLHALKPLGNSEAEGYSLGFWRKPGDETQYPHKYNEIAEGEWDYNYRNWNAIRGFLKHMPWNSVRYTVDEDVVRYDQRIMAYKTPDGRLAIALTNRSESSGFGFNIDTGIEKEFRGYRYTPMGEDEIELGLMSGRNIKPMLPGFSIEFWVQEPDENTVPVNEVILDKENITLPLNRTAKLTAGVLPENAANKGVTYVSDDATIAEVAADGTITPLKTGETMIVATALSGSGQYKAVCTVTVTGDVVEQDEFELRVTAGSGGKAEIINGSENGLYKEGDQVTLRAEAETGYEFTGWTSSEGSFADSKNPETVFTMPGKAASVQATFKKAPVVEQDEFKLRVTAGNGGKAEIINGSENGLYKEGDQVTLRAEAETGYEFSGWTSSEGSFADSKKPETVFTMPRKAASVQAAFKKAPVVEQDEFELRVTAGSGGKAEIINGSENGLYKEGDQVTLRAEAETGYEFTGWTSSEGSFADSKNPETVFTMPGKAASVQATFKKAPVVEQDEFELRVTAGNGGKAEIINGSENGLYKEGDQVTLRAEAETGYEFSGWTSSDGSFADSKKPETVFTMPGEDTVINALFTKRQYTSSGNNNSTPTVKKESAIDSKWDQDSKGWRYPAADGTWVKNEWRHINNMGVYQWFFFNEEGYMADGWIEWKGRKYFLHTVSDGKKGEMYTGWKLIDSKWYYFDTSVVSAGALLTNTVTPDGYRVDGKGVWIQ